MTCERCADQPPDRLLEGIELFNAAQFYECHEILEDIWRAESDPIRALYQGILQIGVAFHHLRRGNWRGAVKLLNGGTEKVGRFLPNCLKIDTATLNEQATACLRTLNVIGPERVTEFDWSLVPTIAVYVERSGSRE